jgi:ketosteroid isomerase-like protein
MLKRSFVIMALAIAFASLSFARNANTHAQAARERTSTRATTTTTQRPVVAQAQEQTSGQQETTTPARTRRGRGNQGGGGDTKGVLAAFNALLDGIRRADVGAVTGIYWNSPQLVLFNNNGTVTKGWEQMRENRASSYPEMKDVKLDVRDVRVQMLGREGAVVTALWTQSQTFRGTPESATGRMTLVFRRVGTAWKAIHLHTSPDKPEPSRVLPSEQIETPTPAATPTPKTKP